VNNDTRIESTIGDCRPLADLQSPGFVYVDLDRNIQEVAERAGFRASDTSAIVVAQSDCNIEQVWTTDSARPFELHAPYTRLQ